jgi:hypothetical protein
VVEVGEEVGQGFEVDTENRKSACPVAALTGAAKKKPPPTRLRLTPRRLSRNSRAVADRLVR